MRTLGILALVGAGVGFLLGTERGRSCLNQVGQMLQDGYSRMTSRSGSEGSAAGELGEVVQGVLEQPHEDTALARAFESATAA